MAAGDTYKIRMRSLAEREAKIAASVEASKETRDFHDFRNQATKLPFIRLPEDYLVYRMENFRTYIAQNEYMRRDKKAFDYFKTGQESETVQQLQHEILAKIARQGRADSVTPVIDVLRVEAQREPLLITHHGVVVNGNRRLAAMRELFTENSKEFSGLGYVDCLVLPPDATAAEIVDIEGALQAKPETRLDYDWIGDCQLIQRLLELGRTVDQVGKRLNRKPSEISNSLAALVEANLYLRDWAQAEGEYRRVLDAEQLFKDLPDLLQNKESSQADASRMVAWNLLENRNKLGVRLYAFNSVIGKHATQVLERVSTDLNLPKEESDTTDDGSFAVDVEGGSEFPSYASVISALRSPDRKEEAAEVLIDTCRDIVEQERNKKGQNAALKAVTAAYARLMEVNLGAAEARTYEAIGEHLDKVINRASGLKSLLAKLRNDADS